MGRTDGKGADPSAGVGLYGKLPIKPDFIRVNAGGFSAAGFDRWLEEGLDALNSAGLELPENGFDLLLAANSGTIGLGTLLPSRDKVGRSFPAVLFTYLDGASPLEAALTAELADGFLRAAEGRLLALVRRSEPDATDADLSGLPPTQAASLHETAGPIETTLASMSIRSELEALFVPGDGTIATAALAGAVGTLIAACQTVAGSPPPRATLTVELPAFSTRNVSMWLTLAERCLGWSVSPSWIWARQTARLIVALGPPCKEMLVELGRSGRPGPRHWVVEPSEGAAGGTPARARDLLDLPATTFGDWLASLPVGSVSASV